MTENTELVTDVTTDTESECLSTELSLGELDLIGGGSPSVTFL